MQIKGVISVILFIFLRCHLGSALNCYSCTGECEGKTTKPCGQGEQCMTLETYSADGKLQERRMDCLNAQYCTNTQVFSSLVQKCCDKDLCNDPRSASMTTSKPNTAGDVSRDTPLQCYACDFPCTDWPVTTCQSNEFCVTTGTYDTQKRGCANTTVCNKDTSENMADTRIKCCNTNLCNAAVHLEVPVVALLAAIVVVWTAKLC